MNKIKTKIIAILLILTIFVSTASVSNALTASEFLDILIKAGVIPNDKIELVRDILRKNEGSPSILSNEYCKYAFVNSNLAVGYTDNDVSNSDVTKIQKFLEVKGFLNIPGGVEYGYYGRLTRAAVIKYQISNGIISSATQAGAGTVGPLTREKMQEECNSTNDNNNLPPSSIPNKNDVLTGETVISVTSDNVNIIDPMRLKTDADGTKYVSTDIVNTGEISFKLNIKNSSNYYIWTYTKSASPAKDSFVVLIDGKNSDIYDSAAENWDNKGYKWTVINGRGGSSGTPLAVNPRIFNLNKGEHTLTFKGREIDTRLNRILITDDKNYVPTGAEKPREVPKEEPKNIPKDEPKNDYGDNSDNKSDWNIPGTTYNVWVSPNGSSSGNGSKDSPWNFFDVIEGKQDIKGNTTIFLKEGVYRKRPAGDYDIKITSGSKDNPIIIRPVPGEKAVIDGMLSVGFYDGSVNVNGIWIVGLEIVVSEPMHLDGTDTVNRPSLGGIWFSAGRDHKIINNIVHRATSSGISVWSTALGVEIYGNIVYDNGNVKSDRTHGHGVYTQNKGPYKIFKHNIIVTGPEGYQKGNLAFQLYGSSRSFVENVDIIENIFLGRIIIGKPDPGEQVNNIKYISNVQDKGGINIGYLSDNNGSGVYKNNVITGGSIAVHKWENLETGGNILYANNPNRYLPPKGEDYLFNTVIRTFNKEGKDDYKIFENKYDPNRAYIAALDVDNSRTVSVNLNSFLKNGDSYKIYKYDDLFGNPVAEGVYNGSNIVLNAFVSKYNYQNTESIVQPFVVIKNKEDIFATSILNEESNRNIASPFNAIKILFEKVISWFKNLLN